MRVPLGPAPARSCSNTLVVSVLATPLLLLVALYTVLAVAVHDHVVLGLPGAYPADAAAFATAGLVVVWHRRRHPAGWVMFAFGLLLLLQTDGVLLSIVHYRRHADPLPLGTVAVLAGLLWVPMMAAVPAVVALFPDGRIPIRWARAVLSGFVAGAAVTSTYFYVHAVTDLTRHHVNINLASGDLNEIDIPHGALAWWYAAWGSLVIGGLVGAIASLIVKQRRVDGDIRQQLRWFIFGTAVATVAVVPVVAMSTVDLPPDSLASQLPAFALAVTLVLLPVTIVVGVLKYRLYDLNIVVSRSITYALVAAGITVSYLAVVTVLSVTISHGTRSLTGSVLATLAAAAMFQPLRLGAHRLANRVVYGKRATPYEALSTFADQLGSTPDLDTVLARAAYVLAAATGAQRVTVWLSSDDDLLRALATWPPEGGPPPINRETLASAGDPTTVTELVSHQHQPLGGISVTKRPGDPVTQTDRQLLHQLAAQAGLALRNSKLTTDLHHRLADLDASRRRLVTAQDEARRHIERDLHDGAQQHLIVLNMKLGRLRKELANAAQPAAKTVTQLQAEVDRAIENIRALAHGIFPSLLADHGLTAALRSQLRDAPLPVSLDSALHERCSQQVEAAAYFCAMEALQNVYRHAAASRASVCLTHPGDRLLVEVTDDGRGFVPAQRGAGSGLTNIKDRAESLGGRVMISSSPGSGSSVVIELPGSGSRSQLPDPAQLSRL